MDQKIILQSDDAIVTTGFASLDSIIGGFRSGGLYILAGAPGIGKSALAISMIKRLAENGHRVGFFTYEATEKQIALRIISYESGIPYHKLVSEPDLEKVKIEAYEFQKLYSSLSQIVNLKIFIDSVNCKIDTLVSKIKTLQEEKKVDLIVIDDLQRIPIDEISRNYAINREQEISANVRYLKKAAREFNLPIMCVSQLNRSFETRYGKRPLLTDLRDSGAIENDSDAVFFLHRDEFYGILNDKDGSSTIGKAELLVSKNRHGVRGSAQIQYDNQNHMFMNKEFREVENVVNANFKNEDEDFNFSDNPPF